MPGVAQADLYKENFDNAVKNIAAARTVIRDDVCNVEKSSSAEEHFYQETVNDLRDSTQIPKDASFYSDWLEWVKTTIRAAPTMSNQVH